MISADAYNAILRHTYSEPRSAAFIEWSCEYSIGSQLEWQVGRKSMETYAHTGQWPELSTDEVVFYEFDEPDWEWWEPTSQWRWEAARERELDAELAYLRKTD